MSTLARQIDGKPLLAHEWGASEAVDHIWAEICGRPPSTEPWRRWFVVVQCYLDVVTHRAARTSLQGTWRAPNRGLNLLKNGSNYFRGAIAGAIRGDIALR